MRRLSRVLLNLGIAMIVVGLSLYHARSIADPPYSYTGTFRFGWSIFYIIILALAAYGFGLPEIPRTPRQALTRALGSALVAALGISVVQLVAGDALLPRFVVFGAAVALIPWYLLCVAFGGSQSATVARDRVLVVSGVVDASRLREEVNRSPERPVILTDIVPVDLALGDGAIAPLVNDVIAKRVKVLVLDRDAQSEPSIVSQAGQLHERGIRVRTLSLFYDEWLGMLPMAELERVSLMFDIGELHRGYYGRLKRVIDLVFAILGLLVLLIVTPFVLVGNLLANRGPLIYRQERVGKGGAPFTMIKFRTMRDDPSAATEWTAQDDSRITRFGQLLRVSHLDELPQVINILRGDLSVVGPRPEQPSYVTQLSEALPFYRLRHLVRPGLTGWAQVKFGYAGDESDSLEKLQYDFFYLRHQRLGLDLRIIGRTLRSVIGGEGR